MNNINNIKKSRKKKDITKKIENEIRFLLTKNDDEKFRDLVKSKNLTISKVLRSFVKVYIKENGEL